MLEIHYYFLSDIFSFRQLCSTQWNTKNSWLKGSDFSQALSTCGNILLHFYYVIHNNGLLLQFTLFEKQGKRHQTTGILWDVIEYLQSTLASKWLASDISCVFKMQWIGCSVSYGTLLSTYKPSEAASLRFKFSSLFLSSCCGGWLSQAHGMIKSISITAWKSEFFAEEEKSWRGIQTMMICLWKLNYVDADLAIGSKSQNLQMTLTQQHTKKPPSKTGHKNGCCR